MSNFDLLLNPVEFVLPAAKKSPGIGTITDNEKTTESPSKVLDGNKIKKIYEEIVNEPSLSTKHKTKKQTTLLKGQHKKKEKTKNVKKGTKMAITEEDKKIKLNSKTISDNKTMYTDKLLLKATQENNLEIIKKCKNIGNIDLNIVDQYNWTPLMIAAFAGYREIVDYLLLNGAKWNDIFDGRGYDARELACIGGHYDIAEKLANKRKYIKYLKVKECKKCIENNIKKEKIWCETCEYNYTATLNGNEQDHNTSILHLFSHRRKDKEDPKDRPHYFIPNKNKGYQLLQKSGWDESSGLGPSGSGAKYPVKTVLKRDRSGLGSDSNKAKITHFGSNDKNAIKRQRMKKAPKLQTKDEMKQNKIKMTKKEKRQKDMEIDFRLSFNYD